MNAAALLAADPNTALFKPAAPAPTLRDAFGTHVREMQAKDRARQGRQVILSCDRPTCPACKPAAAAAALAARRAKYIGALHGMDWTYAHSDDYGVFCAGAAHYQRLRYEQRAIDPDRLIWDEVTSAAGVRA